MSDCEPGHDWQLEAQSTSWVKYRCAECGSLCIAPKPAPQRESLVVPGPGANVSR